MRTINTRRWMIAGACVAIATMATIPSARADNEGGSAAAEQLFQEARRLMDAKKYSDACPKLAASQRLSPAIGTLLNLADCYEKNNQLASAWARFHEAIALAQRLNRPNREQTAHERADKLEPRLIKLTINAHSSGLEVKLDGNSLDPAVLGTAVPVDAGKHTVEATQKNKKPFSKDIDVNEKKKDPSIDIPLLEDEPVKDPAPVVEKKDPGITEPPKEEHSNWSTQKTIGVVAAGAGVIGLGVGGFFGLKTSSTWKDAQSHCTAGLECDQAGVDLASQAKSSGNIATIAVIAGSALVIGGAVLFFTAPSGGDGGGGHVSSGQLEPRKQGIRMRVGVGVGSVVLGGSFF